jgi:hypothetical protein
MTGYPAPEGGLRVSRVSFLNYADIVGRVKGAALAAYQPDRVRLGARGAERVVAAEYVSASYFDVLGVTMQLGRAFMADADDPRLARRAAVISDTLWSSMFGRDPGIVGRTASVNGQVVVIAAVAAAGFAGLHHAAAETVWLPGVAYAALSGLPGLRADDRASGGYYLFIARPMPAVEWSEVREELAAQTAWLAARYPAENGKFTLAGFHDAGPIGCLARR